MKQKKLFLAALLAAAMSAAAVMGGCSAEAAAQQEPEIEYADEAVIKALRSGLEARWDLVGSEGYDPNSMLDDAVQAELDALSGFANAPYQDKELHELVLSYANALDDSLKAWELYGASPEHAREWDGLYDERTQMLKTFAEDYGLTVSPEHQERLSDLLANATAVEWLDAERGAVERLVSGMAFEPVEETGYYCEYGAVATNDTGRDIGHISIDVAVYDAENVRIEDAFLYVENWASGETVRLAFTADPSIASYKLTLSDYALA